ncbi:N-formylglutamate amidohydrolase (plasmid) [Rhodobacteraceae bacterium SC52]|nr:N-formylglutamate amidohydrolase [Rhodobacteraceae bacterium SC52]
MSDANVKNLAEFGPAVEVTNQHGGGRVVLACEHASAFVPPFLNGLGLDKEAAVSHAAWDIGALDVAKGLAERLDAPLVAGRLSRLVYDCNRPPDAPDAIPARSEIFEVPGNRDLSDADRLLRVTHVYRPFHETLAAVIAERPNPTVLVTMHSFTPVYNGKSREVELGLLHGKDDRLARSMLVHTGQTGWLSALNQPYGPKDGVLHTLDRHAEPAGLLNVMIELRNDLLLTPEDIQGAIERISAVLNVALDDIGMSQEADA